MFDALRGRHSHETLAQPPAEASAQPRAALPDRRRREQDGAPPLDGWLERTGDTTGRKP